MNFSTTLGDCKGNFVFVPNKRWQFQFNLIAKIMSKDRVAVSSQVATLSAVSTRCVAGSHKGSGRAATRAAVGQPQGQRSGSHKGSGRAATRAAVGQPQGQPLQDVYLFLEFTRVSTMFSGSHCEQTANRWLTPL